MRIRVLSAAALAAAVAVWAVVRDRRLRRQLARERVESRLTDGCLVRDLDVFRRRLDGLAAQRVPVVGAGLVPDAVLVTPHRVDPPTEGGPQ